jgi:beta-mannosidase
MEVTARAVGKAKALAVVRTTFGIRDLKMLQNPEAADSKAWLDWSTGAPVKHQLPNPPPERKYLIQINGRRIFARGGNWIPCDLLYGRPRQPAYEHLIRLAAQANYNLFRVWGGGLIDKPEFFELCDRYGITLFQEFPNGGPRLRETDEALAITGREARQILPLLMNHPCIVRYGGGNEWYRDAKTSRQMEQLRKICNEMDPTRPFHDPDPECIAQRHGPHGYEWNQHYRTYNTGQPLTGGPDNPLEWTEYGAAGAASVETLKSIMPAEALWPIRADDPYWIWHKAFHAFGADNWMGSAQYLHLFGELPDLETTVLASHDPTLLRPGEFIKNKRVLCPEWHLQGHLRLQCRAVTLPLTHLSRLPCLRTDSRDHLNAWS